MRNPNRSCTIDQTPLAIANRRQRVILRVGAVYDAGFGIPMLCVPAWLMTTMGLPLPDVGQLWLRMIGILLIILGMIYWIMSGDPSRYIAFVGVILLGKAGSIVYYLAYVFVGHESKMFLLFAFLDAVMFALHYWALGPDPIGRIRAGLKPAPLTAT